MIFKLTVKNKNLEYDDEKDITTLDGKVTKDYIPSFTPNGDDKPDFFGFIYKPSGTCYTIYGTEAKISDESKIKL